MHIVLLRHGSRIDKAKNGVSPTQSSADLLNGGSFNWLSNFDPPLDIEEAASEMDAIFKKIQNNVIPQKGLKSIMIHSSPYNRCIQTSELLLDKIKNSKQFEPSVNSKCNIKLRVDQALSEWLSENYNLQYLPPNDDGYSMINNVNAYLNQPENSDMDNEFMNGKTREQLRIVKDQMWSYNQLGHCGEYGESPSDFTKRCFNYLIYLLQYYYMQQAAEDDKQMVVFVVSHGAVISTLMQILLGRSIFNEIPVCTPIYFKQSDKRRSVFRLMDYDFNLNSLLTPSSDQEFYRILENPIDLTKLDPDNLRSELTIGTTGYTTIIQSLPNTKKDKDKHHKHHRKRRNTFTLGDTEHDETEEQDKVHLKQTLSSKQLYLMNKDTSEEKIIDLEKLHSYFGSESESESGNSSESDEGSIKENIFRGRISSLSSFNEENKNKFLLNKNNFYSKPTIQQNPYSHFFLERKDSSTGKFDDSAKLFKRFGTNDSLRDLLMKESANTFDNSNNDLTDEESLTSNSSNENLQSMLTFGRGNKVPSIITTDEDNEDGKVKEEVPVVDGASRKTLISNGSLSNLLGKGYTLTKANNNLTEFPSATVKENTQLGIPTLISSTNNFLKVRGSSSNLNSIKHNTKSKEALKQILFNSNDSDDEDDSSSDSGWFGGFSR
ncbi:hypothetical protein DAMA08_037890 [Martiniozyma asiatica (nom. inval.)]|nr:hypothetical protein DAMA08_037890 [Martiniozyma asiatica]